MHLSRVEKRRSIINFASNIANVDVLGITETWFKEGKGNDLMLASLVNSDYCWYGRDRPKQTTYSGDGGVGFLIKKNLGKI